MFFLSTSADLRTRSHVSQPELSRIYATASEPLHRKCANSERPSKSFIILLTIRSRLSAELTLEYRGRLNLGRRWPLLPDRRPLAGGFHRSFHKGAAFIAPPSRSFLRQKAPPPRRCAPPSVRWGVRLLRRCRGRLWALVRESFLLFLRNDLVCDLLVRFELSRPLCLPVRCRGLSPPSKSIR